MIKNTLAFIGLVVVARYAYEHGQRYYRYKREAECWRRQSTSAKGPNF